jgi:hypothetical protein
MSISTDAVNSVVADEVFDAAVRTMSEQDFLNGVASVSRGETHGFREPRAYKVRSSDGRLYPIRPVVAFAVRSKLSGYLLIPDDFSAGRDDKCYKRLRELGFEKVPIKERASATGSSARTLGPPALSPRDAEQAYTIENLRREVEVRQKQSIFRERVLENFGRSCCLSGIHEEDLLVASHIVPWSESESSRLDPANGLLLHNLYDKMFDKGYITFTDDLHVLIVPWAMDCSVPLRRVLSEIAGRQARRPRWPINPAYLAYHRDSVFRRPKS